MSVSAKKSHANLLSSDVLDVSAVYILGDSLVDSGNALGLAEWFDGLPFAALPEGAPTQDAGYFDGRFSNGYTFADLLANRLVGSPSEPVFPFGYDDPWIGIPLAPFSGDPRGDSLNFAYGGAQIIRGEEVVSDLDEQTDALRDAVDGSFDPGDVVILTIGGNDVRELAPASGDLTPRYHAWLDLQRSAAELLSELSQLASRGLQHIVLTGIPDVGLIPRYDVDGDGVLDGSNGEGGGWKGYLEEFHFAKRASEYSAYLDELIRTEVIPQLEAMGVTVDYIPLANVTDPDGNVIEQGALEAILPTIAALNGLTVEAMKADWLEYADLVFFDSVHPNAQVHALVGSYIHAQLEGSEWVEVMPMLEAELYEAFTGTISEAGETDAFLFTLQEGVAYTINVLGMSTLGADGSLADPTLTVTNFTGRVRNVFIGESGDDAGLGFDGNYVFVAPHTGRFYLIVGAEGGLTGNYELRIGVVEDTFSAATMFGKEALLFEATLDLTIQPFVIPEMERPMWDDLNYAYLHMV